MSQQPEDVDVLIPEVITRRRDHDVIETSRLIDVMVLRRLMESGQLPAVIPAASPADTLTAEPGDDALPDTAFFASSKRGDFKRQVGIACVTGIFSVIVGAMSFVGGIVAKDSTPVNPPNCVQVQREYVQFLKENPGIKLPKYTDPSAAQCHLSEIQIPIQQPPSQQPHP
jgi:hypothetical protein